MHSVLLADATLSTSSSFFSLLVVVVVVVVFVFDDGTECAGYASLMCVESRKSRSTAAKHCRHCLWLCALERRHTVDTVIVLVSVYVLVLVFVLGKECPWLHQLLAMESLKIRQYEKICATLSPAILHQLYTTPST